MRKISALAVFVIFVAATLLAHGGHVHNFLGTVKSVAGDELVITTPDHKDVAFVLTSSTTYVREGKTARRDDLAAGLRVSVHVADDGRTATSIKLGTK